MRVSAHLEGEYERQLEFLTEATGLGVSDVLKASVRHYYKVVSEASQPRLVNLRKFIGKQGSGRSDVSTRSRELFAESLASKHRNQPRRSK